MVIFIKSRGKGSYILDINKFNFPPITGITSFKEISKNLGTNSNTIVEELEIIKPDNYLIKKIRIIQGR